MRHITEDGLGRIKQFEGFSRGVYFCYGRVVKDGEDLADGINEEQAEGLLWQDAVIAE